MRDMMLADESECVLIATRLPGLFGKLTASEFVERFGLPCEAQIDRLLRFLSVENGRFVPKPRRINRVDCNDNVGNSVGVGRKLRLTA